jgi:hypothetical protein
LNEQVRDTDRGKVTATQGLVLAVALGAAAIALWLDVRFEARTPQTLAQAVLHAAVAVGALQLLPTILHVILAGSDSPVRKMAAVFAAVLPTLTYVWLASIWLLKVVQRAARLR